MGTLSVLAFQKNDAGAGVMFREHGWRLADNPTCHQLATRQGENRAPTRHSLAGPVRHSSSIFRHSSSSPWWGWPSSLSALRLLAAAANGLAACGPALVERCFHLPRTRQA